MSPVIILSPRNYMVSDSVILKQGGGKQMIRGGG